VTRTVALATLVTVMVCVPAQARVRAGAVTPNGVALVTGKLGHRVRRPKSFALSRDGRFGKGDVVLGAATERARHGTFRAWVAFPDATRTGRRNLLACKAAKPSRRGCVSVGRVRVGRAPTPRVATPALDQAHAAHTNIDFRGGTATAIAADGTTFTVTVPRNATVALDVRLTPVTALAPAGAVGRLATGVMIGPLGDAPPGSTLTITLPQAPPKHAAVVAFGGADPSGAAFRLPVVPKRTTTIPLTQLGGYGLAVAARRAHAGVARAACGAPATAHLDAAGSRPIISCVTVAQVMQQLSDAVVASNFDPAVIDAASQAAMRAVDDEIKQVTDQPPSEAGLAEIEAVLPYAIAVERQRELMGLPQDAFALVRLGKALQYEYKLFSDLCGKTQPRSDVYYAFGLRLIGLARQQELLGQPLPGDVAQLFDKCVSRIHLQLDSLIDATTHTSGGLAGTSSLVGHVKIHVDDADIVVKNNGQGFLGHTLALQTPHLPLVFDTNEATIDPPFPHVTASASNPNGTFQIEFMSLQAVTRVRCDKNKKLVVEHTVTLNVFPPGMWDDHETDTFLFDGAPVSQIPGAVAAEAWAETFARTNNVANPIAVPLDETPVPRSSHGPCTVIGAAGECTSYTYSARLVGRALPG
jgi:hypothetical protein